MHLVFATSLIPDDRLISGFDIANTVIVDALKRTGVRITLVGFKWPGKGSKTLENNIVLGEVDLRTESVSIFQKIRWLSKALYFGMTFSSVKMRTISAARLTRELKKIEPFDGFIINGTQFAGAFQGLLQSKPFIFIAHNVEFRSSEENATSTTSLLKKYLYRREARLLKRLEMRLCSRASYILTLAEEDRFTLGVADDKRSAALTLVASTEQSRPSPRPVLSCDLALIGNWTWQPNRTGLDWFLREVVPLLPHTVKICIAGYIPPDIHSDHPGVALVGNVTNALAFLQSAAVIPLISRAGTGIQLKTIEVFENGFASVATSHSLRGIGYTPSNCFVTDDAKKFAEILRIGIEQPPIWVDGSTFYYAQRKTLDQRIQHSLNVLAKTLNHFANSAGF